MKLLKSILDFYIRSSLHVAVCFVALLKVVSITGSYFIPNSLFIISFCAILIGYNFIKYGKLIWLGNTFRFKPSIIICTLLFSLIGIYYLSMENYQVWLVVGILGLISSFYAIPWIGNRTLREFPTLKLFTVVVCWTLLLFALPEYSNSASKAVFTDNYGYNDRILITQVSSVFFFIYALCIPFEIRDLSYDHENLQTLPQKIGIKKTKIFGIILLLISFLLDWLGDYHTYFYSYLDIDLPFSITIGITILAIWFSDKFKSDYYASFFVEAIPILWLGLYYFL